MPEILQSQNRTAVEKLPIVVFRSAFLSRIRVHAFEFPHDGSG